MPARDIYHQKVRNALVKDGWTITADPLVLPFGDRNVYVDLGAEKFFEAEKGDTKIAVEVKSFVGPSPVNEIHNALGQYMVYLGILKRDSVKRILYLAIPEDFYRSFFNEALGKLILEDYNLNVIIFNTEQEVIVEWLQKTN